jgi:hypothetical protein
MNEKPKLKIDWASYDSAKYACINWHYSKAIPAGKLIKVGAWEDDKFIGVVIFSRGACHNLLKPYGLEQNYGCELTRIALTNHYHPVSKILSIALKFLSKKCPGLKLVVSYADLDQNHHGGIYQATNWIYEGVTAAGTTAYIVNGKKTHKRSLAKLGRTTQENIKNKLGKSVKMYTSRGKHKYIYVLDKDMYEKIKQRAKKYPKRSKWQESEHHSDLGGSTPT